MSGNEDKNHPAYQHILDVIPDSLHSLVIPELKKWDAGVTQKFQEIHAQYEPLKPFQKFVDNEIDPQYAEQAVIFADELQRDPKSVVSKINESWDLGYVPKEQIDQQQDLNLNDDPDLSERFEGLENHPEFKAMKQAFDALQQSQEEQRSQQEQEQALAEFESELDELEKSVTDPNREGGPLQFNRLFVTALVQQGIDPEDAVKQYNQVLAGNVVTQTDTNSSEQDTNNQQPPVVMGGNGAGSGTPTETIDFGSQSKDETSKFVEDLLRQQAESGN